jgi:RNA polymerase sigma factor (sigma-70 family)
MHDAAPAVEVDPAAHLGLVFLLARQFEDWALANGHGIEFADLVGEGTVAVVEAARDFDPARGWKFTSLATVYIRNAILRLVDASRREKRGAGRRTVSVIEGYDLADPSPVDPDAGLRGEDTRRHVSELLAALGPRCRHVVALRYGLHGHELHTLDDVAEVLGVSRQRVQQIEARAMGQLRRVAIAKQIRGALA